MKIKKNLLSLLGGCLISLFILSCSDETTTNEEERAVPQASGKLETVVVIMDSSYKSQPLGKVVDSILSFSLPGLIFDEKVLAPHYIHPTYFGNTWERQRHIFVPLTLDGSSDANSKIRAYFTEELLKNKDKDFFSFIKKDVFAEGQDTYVVVGKDMKTLVDSLPTKLESIRYFYDQSILKGIQKNLERNSSTKAEKVIDTAYALSFIIPNYFQVAAMDSQFYWLRKAHEDYDLNVFFNYDAYTSEKQFDDENIIAWRNKIGQRNLLGTDSHMETQMDPAPVFEEKVINGIYTKVGRGLWQMSGNNFMGGYFVSYTFANENNNRIYYLESFLYYPRQNSSAKYWAEKMRKYREGEAIINSFELK